MKWQQEFKKQNLAADQLPGPALSGVMSESTADEVAAGVAPVSAIQQNESPRVRKTHRETQDNLPEEMSMEWYANDLWSPAYRGSLTDFHGRLADNLSEEDAHAQLSRDK